MLKYQWIQNKNNIQGTTTDFGKWFNEFCISTVSSNDWISVVQLARCYPTNDNNAIKYKKTLHDLQFRFESNRLKRQRNSIATMHTCTHTFQIQTSSKVGWTLSETKLKAIAWQYQPKIMTSNEKLSYLKNLQSHDNQRNMKMITFPLQDNTPYAQKINGLKMICAPFHCPKNIQVINKQVYHGSNYLSFNALQQYQMLQSQHFNTPVFPNNNFSMRSEQMPFSQISYSNSSHSNESQMRRDMCIGLSSSVSTRSSRYSSSESRNTTLRGVHQNIANQNMNLKRRLDFDNEMSKPKKKRKMI